MLTPKVDTSILCWLADVCKASENPIQLGLHQPSAGPHCRKRVTGTPVTICTVQALEVAQLEPALGQHQAEDCWASARWRRRKSGWGRGILGWARDRGRRGRERGGINGGSLRCRTLTRSWRRRPDMGLLKSALLNIWPRSEETHWGCLAITRDKEV